MSAKLWGGLGGMEPFSPPGLRWTFVVDADGFVSTHDLDGKVEAALNRDRITLGCDPWVRWQVAHKWEIEHLGRRELRADVCSARRGTVGQVVLIWPAAADLEIA